MPSVHSISPSSSPSPSSCFPGSHQPLPTCRPLHLFLSLFALARTPRPPLLVSWPILCLAQVSVSLGAEATIAARVLPVPVTGKGAEWMRWIEQAIFFVGLYQTVLTWVEMFVKPVADDSIFGTRKTDTLVDRMMVGMALSALWLSMLSAEVEPLILAAGKQWLVKDAGWSSFVPWLIGFATTVVGMMKVVEGAVWIIEELLCLQRRDTEECLPSSDDLADSVFIDLLPSASNVERR